MSVQNTQIIPISLDILKRYIRSDTCRDLSDKRTPTCIHLTRTVFHVIGSERQHSRRVATGGASDLSLEIVDRINSISAYEHYQAVMLISDIESPLGGITIRSLVRRKLCSYVPLWYFELGPRKYPNP